MSTIAAWLFALAGLALLGMILLVVLAVRALWRKGQRLAGEIDGLQGEIELVIGSTSEHHHDAGRQGPRRDASAQDRYAGHHGRDRSRQEEVDHG